MASLIEARQIGKRFRRYHPDRPTTLKEAITRGPGRLFAHESVWAVRDVSFSVGRGEMIGLVGANGAGKSTLLRLIGGVGRLDSGQLQVRGRVGALLDLGSGFNPDLTGRENVLISGVIDGLTRRQVLERFDEIVAFAELGPVIDDPLRTYSTGMQLRLAFAVAVHVAPDILLIDEVLAVGDIAFQRKCLNRVEQLRSAGCAIILVTHDSRAIRELCNHAMWLRQGHLVAYGPASVVVDQYESEMSEETRRRTPTNGGAIQGPNGRALRPHENRFGSQEVEIHDVQLLSAMGGSCGSVVCGATLGVQIDLVAVDPTPAPLVGVSITRDRDHIVCVDINSPGPKPWPPSNMDSPSRSTLWLDRLDLAPGSYHVNVGAYESGWAYAYDYHWQVYPLTIIGDHDASSVMQPPYRWHMSNA